MLKRQLPVNEIRFDPETESLDGIWNHRLNLIQPRKGYRYSVDAPLLTDFVKGRKATRALDLGCGCGIIGLMLLEKHKAGHVVGIELQSELAGLARRNASINGLAEYFDTLNMDLRKLGDDYHDSFNLIISNPPFYKKGSGILSPNEQIAIAKHELECDIWDIGRIAARCLKSGGHLAIIYPAERLPDIMLMFEKSKLSPTRLCMVHSKENGPAVLVLAEARKGKGKPLTVEGPFILYGPDGVYTERALHVWEGDD